MVPVIRIDEEVSKRLQAEARPLVETPNDVLRRILQLDEWVSSETEDMPTERADNTEHDSERVKDSIFIVVNAAGKSPNKENANNGHVLVSRRVASGVDYLSPSRYRNAARMLRQGSRIVMHQGGAKSLRRYHSAAGHLVAAGRVREAARQLVPEDRHAHNEDLELAQERYAGWSLAGKIMYEFPQGKSREPLPKEKVPYQPRRGDNFIEIRPDDPRYPVVDDWWRANS